MSRPVLDSTNSNENSGSSYRGNDNDEHSSCIRSNLKVQQRYPRRLSNNSNRNTNSVCDRSAVVVKPGRRNSNGSSIVNERTAVTPGRRRNSNCSGSGVLLNGSSVTRYIDSEISYNANSRRNSISKSNKGSFSSEDDYNTAWDSMNQQETEASVEQPLLVNRRTMEDLEIYRLLCASESNRNIKNNTQNIPNESNNYTNILIPLLEQQQQLQQASLPKTPTSRSKGKVGVVITKTPTGSTNRRRRSSLNDQTSLYQAQQEILNENGVNIFSYDDVSTLSGCTITKSRGDDISIPGFGDDSVHFEILEYNRYRFPKDYDPSESFQSFHQAVANASVTTHQPPTKEEVCGGKMAGGNDLQQDSRNYNDFHQSPYNPRNFGNDSFCNDTTEESVTVSPTLTDTETSSSSVPMEECSNIRGRDGCSSPRTNPIRKSLLSPSQRRYTTNATSGNGCTNNHPTGNPSRRPGNFNDRAAIQATSLQRVEEPPVTYPSTTNIAVKRNKNSNTRNENNNKSNEIRNTTKVSSSTKRTTKTDIVTNVVVLEDIGVVVRTTKEKERFDQENERGNGNMKPHHRHTDSVSTLSSDLRRNDIARKNVLDRTSDSSKPKRRGGTVEQRYHHVLYDEDSSNEFCYSNYNNCDSKHKGAEWGEANGFDQQLNTKVENDNYQTSDSSRRTTTAQSNSNRNTRPSNVSNVTPTTDLRDGRLQIDKTIPMIEVAPQTFSRLRTANETMRCIQNDFYIPFECTNRNCFACNTATAIMLNGSIPSLFCIQDADYIICPYCKMLSPNPTGLGFVDGGVCLGFTFDELAKWQNDITSSVIEIR